MQVAARKTTFLFSPLLPFDTFSDSHYTKESEANVGEKTFYDTESLKKDRGLNRID